MSANLISTTDTPEQVQAALGRKDPPAAPVEKPAVEEAPAEKVETSEAQTQEEKPEGEAGGKDADQPKKKSGTQKRIGKLAARATRAEERAFNAEKEAQYWREQAAKTVKPAETAPTEVAKPADGRPVQENFTTHEAYFEALAEWKADQRVSQKLTEREQAAKAEQVKATQAEQEQAFFKERAEFAKSKDDFSDVMDGIQGVQTSLTVYQAVLAAKKDGPALLYEMAKDPEEYKRICALPAIDAAVEIGMYKARLAKPSAPQTETKTTKAPKPMKPVGSGSADLSTKSPEDMTFQEYKAWRSKSRSG